MRIVPVIAGVLGTCFAFASTASAAVDIHVDLSTQTMRVTDRGKTYVWPVSTARPGYVTPRGVYHPVSLQAVHYSHEYDMSPMPHSIFFHGGDAIHGTYETRTLGTPVSHGCVRISPAHAALLFSLVKKDGARIVITGTPPRLYRARLATPRQFVMRERERPPVVVYAPPSYYPPPNSGRYPAYYGRYRAYPSYRYGRIWTRDPFPN